MNIRTTTYICEPLETLRGRLVNQEIREIIEEISAMQMMTRMSKEKIPQDQMFAPGIANKLFRAAFLKRGWKESERVPIFNTQSSPALKELASVKTFEERFRIAERYNRMLEPIMHIKVTNKTVDFYKDGVYVEVQFGNESRVDTDTLKFMLLGDNNPDSIFVAILTDGNISDKQSSGTSKHVMACAALNMAQKPTLIYGCDLDIMKSANI